MKKKNSILSTLAGYAALVAFLYMVTQFEDSLFSYFRESKNPYFQMFGEATPWWEPVVALASVLGYGGVAVCLLRGRKTNWCGWWLLLIAVGSFVDPESGNFILVPRALWCKVGILFLLALEARVDIRLPRLLKSLVFGGGMVCAGCLQRTAANLARIEGSPYHQFAFYLPMVALVLIALAVPLEEKEWYPNIG